MDHEYTFTNIHTGPVYVPETERILKPGEEQKFIGVLQERTPKLHDKRILNIVDHGVAKADAATPVIPQVELTDSQKALVEAAKAPKVVELKGKASTVTFDDVNDSGDEAPKKEEKTAPVKEAAKSEAKPVAKPMAIKGK